MAMVSEREMWELSGNLVEFAADGEFELVREIIDIFLSDAQGKIEFLQEAVLVRDVAGAQRIAHSLKGAARELGLLSLAGSAASLECSSADLNAAAFSSFTRAIVERWRDAKESVIRTRDSLPPNPGSRISGSSPRQTRKNPDA